MKILYSVALITLSGSLLFASPQNKEDKQLNKTIEIGQSSSKILMQTLGKNMKQHMKKGGVMDALNFCSSEAVSLTEGVNKKIPNGVTVKRISSKYRNPANEPKKEELAILESFEKLNQANAVLPQYIVQKVDANTDKFYKPLVINNKVCLACHGDISKNDKLENKVKSVYPLDKATNYKMGDLRGAVVVTIKHK
jgi:hypothetical protein